MVINKKSLDNLTSFKKKWQNRQTKTIRVPVIIVDKLMEIAHQLDEGLPVNDSPVTSEIKAIISKVKSQEKGYKINSSRQLINDLLKLDEML